MEIVDNKELRKSVSNHKLKCTVLLYIAIASIRYLGPDRKKLRLEIMSGYKTT